MSLMRAIPRTMLASYFVAAGIKAIRDPESLVPAAEPLVDRVVPLVKEYTPEQVAGYVPENTVTLVRINGIAQVVGGAALATGRGRRLGALLLDGPGSRRASAGAHSLLEERQPARWRAAGFAGHRG